MYYLDSFIESSLVVSNSTSFVACVILIYHDEIHGWSKFHCTKQHGVLLVPCIPLLSNYIILYQWFFCTKLLQLVPGCRPLQNYITQNMILEDCVKNYQIIQ